MLRRCCLVVLGLGGNTELPQLLVKLTHERRNAGLYRTKVVVAQLLCFGWLCAKKRTAGVHEIFTLFVDILVHKEVFLLGAYGRLDRGDIGVSEESENAKTLEIYRLHTSQKRRFLVESLAAVGAKCRGNAQYPILYKCVGGRVPCGVAPRLKGGAKSAGRKAGGVGLALNKLLA